MTGAKAMEERAFQYIDEHQEDMIQCWHDLVMHESGSFDKADLDTCRDWLINRCKDLGALVRTCSYEKAGDMIIADINADAPGQPIIFSGHYDTVFKHGVTQERPFIIQDGKAYGPGVVDMKGGLVMALYVAKALVASGYKDHPIRLVFVGDEEVGHQYSTGVDDFCQAVRGAKAAFNFETGYEDNGFVTGRKGGANAYISIKGIASHAGIAPEKGRSAILEMAHKTIAIQALTDYERGITYNVGLVSGGSATNAVPAEAELQVDIRVRALDQIEEVRRQLETIVNTAYVEGTSSEMTFKVVMPPMETTEAVQGMFTLLEESACELGMGPIYQKSVGGGADSSYEVLEGVPTLCSVGVAGAGNHTVDEYALVDSLFTRAKLVIQTILKIK